MPTGTRNDPFAAFNFIVQIDEVTVAGFSEVSGLGFETDAIDYREGAEAPRMRKLSGLHKYTNIVFSRGFTNSHELWDWRKKVIDGKTDRKAGSIVLRNEAGEEALRWNFDQAWPCKWEGPTFKASANEVAIEKMEICVERVELVV